MNTMTQTYVYNLVSIEAQKQPNNEYGLEVVFAVFLKVRFVSKSETLCKSRWTIKLA